MKKLIMDFFRRGLVACGLGPLVLAVFYLMMQQQNVLQILTVNQVCCGIFSLSALAFIAGSMNIIYQIERLPLMAAILIHGSVLYISYMVTYLLNGWLEWSKTPILVFSAIFVFGYFVIWAFIYLVTQKNTAKLNEKLEKQKTKPNKQG